MAKLTIQELMRFKGLNPTANRDRKTICNLVGVSWSYGRRWFFNPESANYYPMPDRYIRIIDRMI